MVLAEQQVSLLKALSNEQSTFLMWIVDVVFARHVMKAIGDHLAPFMMLIVDRGFTRRHHEYA